MELWNDIITEKSQGLLFDLGKISDFVLIGGWASWLYTQTMKSKDIDVYINFDDFFKLQEFFTKRGITISLNEKLNKYEAKVGEVDIDIYTPHHCNIIISCGDVFKKKWFKSVDSFKVVLPEVLLAMKITSEEGRHETIKGFKDRVDILSLLYKTEINIDLLRNLAKQYNIDLKKLDKTINDSNKEYSYFFQEAEDYSKLKKLKRELLKKIKE